MFCGFGGCDALCGRGSDFLAMPARRLGRAGNIEIEMFLRST